MRGATELRRHWGFSMAEPTIAQRSPFRFDVTQGKSYWWCACGRSKKQPFCDGSHKGTEFSPREFKAEKSEEAWFCACKRTGNQPMCDGSHKRLES
jgi:CDGSH-type Zn-finger protein